VFASHVCSCAAQLEKAPRRRMECSWYSPNRERLCGDFRAGSFRPAVTSLTQRQAVSPWAPAPNARGAGLAPSRKLFSNEEKAKCLDYPFARAREVARGAGRGGLDLAGATGCERGVGAEKNVSGRARVWTACGRGLSNAPRDSRLNAT
jgi:hypothetical protein